MKNTSFKVSEHGNLLMYDRKYSTADIKNIIDRNKLSGLSIFDMWDPLPSLDFLRQFTFLKELSVTCRYDQDYAFLRSLPQLELLSIGPSLPMKNRIDFSSQINLKYLSVQWRKGLIDGLGNCRGLEDLCLVEFKENDFKLTSSLINLVRLRIKTGSMKSLEGVEALQTLETLEIGNCRSLRSISHLSGLKHLQNLKIESCRKIDDYDDLVDLPRLETFKLINCGEIPDFSADRRFPELSKLELLGRTQLVKPN